MRALLAALFMVAAPAVLAQSNRATDPPRTERVDLLASWLDAVDRHRPGTADESVHRAAAWSSDDLRLLREHFQTIVNLIREPELSWFYTKVPGTNREREMTYSAAEVRQLRALANTHGAVAPADRCSREPQNNGSGLNGANGLLKRAAMLHLDVAVAIATGQQAPAEELDTRAGRGSFFVKVDDGRAMGRIGAVSQLETGRELLDRVAEPCRTRSAPGRDPWVRDWYVASLAHQLAQQLFEVRHVSRAVELFRDDAQILALGGASHEALATPLMQAGIGDDQSLRDRVQLGSPASELRRAEDLLRQALRRDERQVEARIRLGNVLNLRGKQDEALRELARAVADAGENGVLAYYARMLYGRALDASGNGAEARTAYEQAIRLYPLAHSPSLALSQMLNQSGDAAGAAAVLERLVDGKGGEDPWWEYYAAAGRSYQEMVRALGAATPASVRP